MYKKTIMAIAALSVILPGFASSPQYIELADSADNLIKEEKWSVAEECIKSALRLEPANFSNALLLSNLGIVQTNQGKMEEALESFRLGLSISPRSSVIRTNRARTLIHQRRYEEALDDLNATLEIDSIQEWPLQMRGLLLIDSKPETARHDFLLLGRKFPQNPIAMTGLAALAERKGDFKEAIKYYTEALYLEESPDTRFSRILARINSDNYTTASEEISEAIARYPDNGDFYLLRGLLNRLQYRYKEAADDKKKALDKGCDRQLADHLLPSESVKGNRKQKK